MSEVVFSFFDKKMQHVSAIDAFSDKNPSQKYQGFQTSNFVSNMDVVKATE